jgi:hypothetical protein
VDCSYSLNPSCLLPMSPVRICDYTGIFAWIARVFQSLPKLKASKICTACTAFLTPQAKRCEARLAQGHSPSNPFGSISERFERYGPVRDVRDSTDALIVCLYYTELGV